MNRFSYSRAGAVDEAVRLHGTGQGARFLAGGTNLVDLMKANVARPARLVDINRVEGLHDIAALPDGGLRIGALVTNATAARSPEVLEGWPLLASAILAGASAQLRNAATTGGNLLQRTRCHYFYDVASPCNKREPGAGCSAIGGVNRIHAILGTSPQCIATHPSDMCVALAALEAVVLVQGPGGERRIAMADFHRLPCDTPERDTNLEDGELITAVELPSSRLAAHHSYLKLRDRQSYAFALVSVAAGLEMAEGRIVAARLALGGVAHRPWRVAEAEAMLTGCEPSVVAFAATAGRLLEGAVAQSGNGFKIELARRAIIRALEQAQAGTPQSQTDKRIA
jgi:xanthine dehydrogenase YagS FAD-binding subunit